MPVASRTWILLGFLFPALAFAQSDASTSANEAPESALEAEGPFVLLRSGEVIEGEVEVEFQRGRPARVAVDGDAYPYYRVRVFRTDDGVYGIAEIGELRPILVERYANGRASLFREVANEDNGNRFFQVGSGPIQFLSTHNLGEALGDDPAVGPHLRRDRLLGVAGVSAAVIGGGMVVTGAMLEFTSVEGPPGVMIALAGVGLAAAVNALIPPLRSSARHAAVDAFNR